MFKPKEIKSSSLIKPRELADFKGEAVVIGCSHNRHCHHRSIHSDALFYTIDYNKDIYPDGVWDIRNEVPLKYKDRFKLTILECLPCDAYSPRLTRESTISQSFGIQSIQGFKNICSITKDDGFIFIDGSPRLKDFRYCVKDMKYIEFVYNDVECILIPKNQSLSAQQVLSELLKIDSGLINVLLKILSLNLESFRDKFKYCELSYDAMETIYTFYHLNKQICR